MGLNSQPQDHTPPPKPARGPSRIWNVVPVHGAGGLIVRAGFFRKLLETVNEYILRSIRIFRTESNLSDQSNWSFHFVEEKTSTQKCSPSVRLRRSKYRVSPILATVSSIREKSRYFQQVRLLINPKGAPDHSWSEKGRESLNKLNVWQSQKSPFVHGLHPPDYLFMGSVDGNWVWVFFSLSVRVWTW